MSVIVADACPVIFLSKLDRLALVRGVAPGPILVPASIQHELTQPAIPAEEQERIRAFLHHCRIETVRSPLFPASSLSLADRHVLTLASKHRPALILTDDGMVRRIALARGLAVMGTLGIIIKAARSRLITQTQAVQAVDNLVTQHRLRIAVALYQEALRQIRQAR